MSIQIIRIRDLFLRLLCAIYMFAFTSLYVQIQGLYGEKGLLPAHMMLSGFESPQQCFIKRKTLLCFTQSIGLNVALMMELIALIGASLSFIGFVWQCWCKTPVFFTLWFFYLSLYQVGQTFLWFQWDSLLLEIGFLAIFVAPLWLLSSADCRPRSLVTMWLIRWALFRLMFASGVVKLQSGCPTWWGLTALDVHYESQCIPTPLAWYAHHLPGWWQKLCVVGTFVIEIPITFFFFSPIRSHRIFAFYSQVLLQVAIIVTGNYNFFNLLTIVLCLSLLDDVHFGYKFVSDVSDGFVSSAKAVICWVFKWLGYMALNYSTLVFFGLKFSPNGGGIDSSIGFTRAEFDKWVSMAVPFSIALGSFSLMLTIAEALTTCLFEIKGAISKFTSFSTTLIYSIFAISLFGISLIPYTSLHAPTNQNLWPGFGQLYDVTGGNLPITSSYGLFRHMTGVGGRPEVVLEGAMNLDGPWIEYEFPYKPGKLDRSPPFVVPHQPRLDWQLWFAALGTYSQNPWMMSLSFRLLQGKKDVVGLLDQSSPWRKKPPKYIRALKYIYHYTSVNEGTGKWWKRTLEGEYMPTYTVDHKPLLDYLKRLQLVGKKDIEVKNTILASLLSHVRGVVTMSPPEYLMIGLILSAALILWTKRDKPWNR